MDPGTKRDRAERKGRGKENAKAKERKARRKEERKARERATVGKERETGGTSIMIRGGWNRSVVTVVTVGNGDTRRQCPQWQGCRPMELGAMVSQPSRTVSDPGCSVSQRVQAVNSSPVSLSVGRNLLTMRRTGKMTGTLLGRKLSLNCFFCRPE